MAECEKLLQSTTEEEEEKAKSCMDHVSLGTALLLVRSESR